MEMDEEFEVTQDDNIAAHRIKNDMCARSLNVNRVLLEILLRHKDELTQDENLKITVAKLEMGEIEHLANMLKYMTKRAKEQNAKGCMAFVIAAIAPLLALAGLAVVKVIA